MLTASSTAVNARTGRPRNAAAAPSGAAAPRPPSAVPRPPSLCLCLFLLCLGLWVCASASSRKQEQMCEQMVDHHLRRASSAFTAYAFCVSFSRVRSCCTRCARPRPRCGDQGACVLPRPAGAGLSQQHPPLAGANVGMVSVKYRTDFAKSVVVQVGLASQKQSARRSSASETDARMRIDCCAAR